MQLARALEAAHAAPEVRAELVQQLKSSVSDGTYRVDAGQLAARMLAAEAAGGTASAEGAQA
jgi:flagellar biosynthesis anti-sigma factor FlgM